MAEILGLDELRANALTTMGFSRFTTGDLGRPRRRRGEHRDRPCDQFPGRRPVARKLRELLQGSRRDRAGRRDHRGGSSRAPSGSVAVSTARWLDGEAAHLPVLRRPLGRRPRARRADDRGVRDAAAPRASWSRPFAPIRALMLLARDDPETALEETARSLELAHRAKDAQVLHPALGTFARGAVAARASRRGPQAADELLEDWSRGDDARDGRVAARSRLCARPARPLRRPGAGIGPGHARPSMASPPPGPYAAGRSRRRRRGVSARCGDRPDEA